MPKSIFYGVLISLALAGCTPQSDKPNASENTPAAAVCTVGQDQTCNDNPALSSLHGSCQADQTCKCQAGFELNPETGKCQ